MFKDVRYFFVKCSTTYRKYSRSTLGTVIARTVIKLFVASLPFHLIYHFGHKSLAYDQQLTYSKVQVLLHGNQCVCLIESSAFYKVITN